MILPDELPTEYPEAWHWLVEMVGKYGYDVLTMREFEWRDAVREEGPEAVLALMLACWKAGKSLDPGMAPPLPSYECGCTRQGSREEGWRVEFCEEHR